jgi:hypothetical protein
MKIKVKESYLVLKKELKAVKLIYCFDRKLYNGSNSI